MTTKELCPKCNQELRGLWTRTKVYPASAIAVKNYVYCEHCCIVYKIKLEELK